MNKGKKLRTALVTSIVSLFACVAMLAGSTFAWFTDSVTSGNNIITAGNLDVNLQYGTYSNGTISWSDVDSNTNLFAADALWEPGHTEVIYLRVVNEGTLSLKYQLKAGIYGANDLTTSEASYLNVNNNTVYLSDYLVFTQTTGYSEVTSRTSMWITDTDEEEAAKGNTLSDVGGTAVLAAGDTDYMTVCAYMPTSVGNEANPKYSSSNPTIYLGLSLIATQTPAESDGFGDDYDETAAAEVIDNSVVLSSSATIGAGENSVSVSTGTENTEGNVKVTASSTALSNSSITLNVTQNASSSSSNISVGTGTSAIYYEISVDGLDGSTPVTVELYVGTDLDNVVLYHNDTAMTAASSLNDVDEDQEYYYDSTTGYITFMTATFSPFTVLHSRFSVGDGTQSNPYEISTEKQLKAVYEVYREKGYKTRVYYKLTADITVDGYYTLSNGTKCIIPYMNNVEIDGNNKTVTINTSGVKFTYCMMRGAVLKDITVDLNDSNLCMWAQNIYEGYGSLEFNNVTLKGSLSVSGNTGAYVIYALGDIDFTDCTTYVDMEGTGTSTDYNAVFVGYAHPYYGGELNFTNCINEGKLVCGRAAMFVGNMNIYNDTYEDRIITITNCKNNGTIQATYINSGYVMNPIAAIQYNNTHYTATIDGVTYDASNIVTNVDSAIAAIKGDNSVFINAPDDATLGLTLNADGTFTITAASTADVAYYEVNIGLYATATDEGGGTLRYYVRETIQANAASLTTSLLNLGFVDETYLATLSEGSYSTTNTSLTVYPYNSADENAVIVTIDGTQYYLLTYDWASFNGSIRTAQMISVSAFDSNGNLLATASYK